MSHLFSINKLDDFTVVCGATWCQINHLMFVYFYCSMITWFVRNHWNEVRRFRLFYDRTIRQSNERLCTESQNIGNTFLWEMLFQTWSNLVHDLCVMVWAINWRQRMQRDLSLLIVAIWYCKINGEGEINLHTATFVLFARIVRDLNIPIKEDGVLT